MGTITNTRAVKTWVVPQPTLDLPAYPSASNAVPIFEPLRFSQEGNYNETQPISEDNTPIKSRLTHFGIGNTELVTAIYSNTPGTAPQQQALLKGLYGKQVDDSDPLVGAVAVTGFTPATSTVYLGISSHGYRVGEIIKPAGSIPAGMQVEQEVKAVTASTVTTDHDSTGELTAGGTISLQMTRYEHADTKQMLTIWQLINDKFLVCMINCVVTGSPYTVKKDEDLIFKFGIDYTEGHRFAVAKNSAAISTGATTISFDSSVYKVRDHFIKEMKILPVALSGTGVVSAAVKVTAVDEVANTITIEAITITGDPLPIGSSIAFSMPATAMVGSPLEQGQGTAFIGAENATFGTQSNQICDAANKYMIRTSEGSVSQKVNRPFSDSIRESDYPDGTVSFGMREVKSTINLIIMDEHLPLFESLKHDDSNARSFAVKIGKTPGKRFLQYKEAVTLKVPQDEEFEESLAARIEIMAHKGSAGALRDSVMYFY